MNGTIFNITAGNAAQFRISLMRGGFIFPVEYSEGVEVCLVSGSGIRTQLEATIGIGMIIVTVPALRAVGRHGIEVKGTLNGSDWRTYTGGIINYTFETMAASAPTTIVSGDPYDVMCEVGVYAPLLIPAGSQIFREAVWKELSQYEDVAEHTIDARFIGGLEQSDIQRKTEAAEKFATLDSLAELAKEADTLEVRAGDHDRLLADALYWSDELD